MTLTVTENVTQLNLTVTENETSIVIQPVVNTVSSGDNDVVLSGFKVYSDNKTNLEAFDVGDTFEGWDNDRYVVGKILALPVTLPDDLDDKTKVGLVINNTY